MAIERELKFRLAPRAAAQAARLLSLGPGVALASVYFDTRDRELSRARAALRLRRVPRSWLQAFKCEQAPGARGEWETAAAHGALDLARLPADEIRRASAIDLRSLERRLRPLFETRFARRATDLRFDDATLEVALDRGAVIAGRKREPLLELEIELKSGAAGRLLRYAQSLVAPLALQLSLASKAERGYRLALGEAPAPRKWMRPAIAEATPHEALARLAAAAFEQIARNAEGVITSDDPEFLHQLRVGLRRLRSLFGAFRALEPKAGSIRRRLRGFGPVLGEARDWDVFLQSRRGVPAAARKARRAARTVVASPAFQEALVRILRWIEQAPWRATPQPLAGFARDSLDRLHRKAMKSARRLDWNDAGGRHALRIRVKRLRYAADAFAGCFPRAKGNRYLAALERLQDHFGALNDIAVARRLDPAARLDAAESRLIARARRDWALFEKRVPFWRAAR
jgi:inorganic triphosphatase YgiF